MAEASRLLKLIARASQTGGSPYQNMLSFRKGRTDPSGVAMSRFFEGMASAERGAPHLGLQGLVPSDSPALAALVGFGYEGAKKLAEQGPRARGAVNAVLDLLPGAADLRIDDSTSPARLANPVMYTAGHMSGTPGARAVGSWLGAALEPWLGGEDDESSERTPDSEAAEAARQGVGRASALR